MPAPARPVPQSGVLRVRTRYCECDPMGVVHHAAYIPWLEMGRTELLRDAGVSYADVEVSGVFLVIVKLELAYKRPAYYDDLVEVRTRVIGGKFASRVKIRHEYEVVRAPESGPEPSDALSAPVAFNEREHTPAQGLRQRRTPGEVLVTASSVLGCVDRSGRPAELPAWLVAAE